MVDRLHWLKHSTCSFSFRQVRGAGAGTETQLRVSWDSVLNAQQTGRWWIVGSSWSGTPMIDSSQEQALQKPLAGTVYDLRPPLRVCASVPMVPCRCSHWSGHLAVRWMLLRWADVGLFEDLVEIATVSWYSLIPFLLLLFKEFKSHKMWHERVTSPEPHDTSADRPSPVVQAHCFPDVAAGPQVGRALGAARCPSADGSPHGVQSSFSPDPCSVFQGPGHTCCAGSCGCGHLPLTCSLVAQADSGRHHRQSTWAAVSFLADSSPGESRE